MTWIVPPGRTTLPSSRREEEQVYALHVLQGEERVGEVDRAGGDVGGW